MAYFLRENLSIDSAEVVEQAAGGRVRDFGVPSLLTARASRASEGSQSLVQSRLRYLPGTSESAKR